MSKYDVLVVGCGVFGATMARKLTDAGKRVLIVDRRSHVAGNCYDYKWDSIYIHAYGAHIFHTNSEEVWKFVNQFSEFYPYRTKVVSQYLSRVYSFPINMMTFHQVYGVKTPQQVVDLLKEWSSADDTTAEGWCLKNMGGEMYRYMVKGYTEKQWGRKMSQIPVSVVKRIPIRLTYDDARFNDKYEALPTRGFTELVKNMVDGIDIMLEVDFLKYKDELTRMADKVVYSGAIDELYGYDMGRLEYRSLQFENDSLVGDYQGVLCVNHTDFGTPYTRVLEWKHLMKPTLPLQTTITREYPRAHDGTNEPYYPINDEKNNALAREYKRRAKEDGYIFGGRMGNYAYYDMDQSIGMALATAKREIENGL